MHFHIFHPATESQQSLHKEEILSQKLFQATEPLRCNGCYADHMVPVRERHEFPGLKEFCQYFADQECWWPRCAGHTNHIVWMKIVQHFFLHHGQIKCFSVQSQWHFAHQLAQTWGQAALKQTETNKRIKMTLSEKNNCYIITNITFVTNCSWCRHSFSLSSCSFIAHWVANFITGIPTKRVVIPETT